MPEEFLAHEEWERVLGRRDMEALLEKMALRDAVRPPRATRLFAEALYALVHGPAAHEERFVRFGEVLATLPRRQTRVQTWPLQTVFGFIARPVVTRNARRRTGIGSSMRRVRPGGRMRACWGSRRCPSGNWRIRGRGT